MSIKFVMEPRVTFLSEFLKEMSEGKIQVPRFQRELVWEWPQRRDLLCSIFEGLPIGALLVWNTRLQNIKSYDKIGPFPVSNSSDIGSRTYLMDGLQRMSTLYGTVYYSGPKCRVEDQRLFEEFAVYCDLECDTVEDLFLLERDINPGDLNTTPYRFMPLNLVFSSKDLLRFQRGIPADRDDLIDKTEEIVSAFRNYKIPVVPLETDDQVLVTKSFERINSRGTIMSEAHMLNALSYSSDFDLLAFIDKEREEHLGALPAWKEQLDVKFVLLLLKMKLGFDPYEKNTDALAKSLTRSPLLLSETFGAIERMAVYSEERLGIESPNDFPYRLQMLGLASELFSESATNDLAHLDRLTSWYWLSTYTNSFGTTARNSQRSLEDLRAFSRTNKLPWTLNHAPICQSLRDWEVSYKAARIKAWAFALARRLDEGGHDASNRALLNLHKGAALVQLGKLRGMPKRPGTCFLFDPKSARKVNIEEWSDNLRQRHFVDSTAFGLYSAGKLEPFVDYRERQMFEWEQVNIILPAAQAAEFTPEIRFAD